MIKMMEKTNVPKNCLIKYLSNLFNLFMRYDDKLQPVVKLSDHSRFPSAIVADLNMLTRLSDQLEIEGEVVNRGDLQTENLLCMDQVVQIGLAVAAVHEI